MATSAAAMASAAPAAAAVLLVNGGGQLTGATGVAVGSSTYDVSFADGACTALFGGCDAASDFTFTTEADAQAAALALLGQVLIDGGEGQFDTNYELTLGCALNNASSCAVLIPFATNGVGATVAQAINSPAQDTNTINASPAVGFDTTGQPNYVYALFTPSVTAVPEASSWAMMLFGFAGIGLATRRRRGAALTAAG